MGKNCGSDFEDTEGGKMTPVIPSTEYVEITGLKFPIMTREAAIDWMLARSAAGETTGIAFPDMKTMNLIRNMPDFQKLTRERLVTLNDGGALQYVSRRRGKSFPDNLNGTDLTPQLFTKAPAGTKVFLLGTEPGQIDLAFAQMQTMWPHINFVGFHHGFFKPEEESTVMQDIIRCKPNFVLVGMGNPLQIQLIERHLDDPELQGIVWLAIGGLFAYYTGSIKRSPAWIRKMRLEWLDIVRQQPHKAKFYFLGIPAFVAAEQMAPFRDEHKNTPESLTSRLKSDARALMVAACRNARGVKTSEPRILCYHGVCEGGDAQWTVNPAVFKKQMEEVATRRPIALDHLIDSITCAPAGEWPLPDRSIAITFDDGYIDVIEHAAPVMSSLGIPGTVFVSPHLATGGTPDKDYTMLRRMMDSQQIRELADAGWEIGSHCLSHGVLAGMPPEKAMAEIADSKSRLEDMIGREVRYIAYPFGTPAKVSPANRKMAANAGYKAGFMAVTGIALPNKDIYSIPRSKVLGTDGFFTFLGILDGCLDNWAFVEKRGRRLT
jgi:exopolysaccharide biosynthesis WecB/TagA/CpsF family protein